MPKSMMVEHGGRKYDYRELSPLCRKAVDQLIEIEYEDSPLRFSYATMSLPTDTVLHLLHDHCVKHGSQSEFGDWLLEYEFDKVAEPKKEIWPVMFTDEGDFLDGYKRLRSYVSRGMSQIPVIAVFS